jgi:uncharacterized protein
VTIAYFDSSAFVKLLVEEPGSELVEQLWNGADTVMASRLALPEVSATLSAARRGARLHEVSERTARRAWSTYWAAADVVELTSSIAADAADLARRLLLGGADAVHLASARTLRAGDPILVSWDQRLPAAALEAGLSVAPSDF